MKKIWKVWTVILVVAATVLLTISTQYSKKEEISTDTYQYLIGVSLPNVIEPWLNNFVDVMEVTAFLLFFRRLFRRYRSF